MVQYKLILKLKIFEQDNSKMYKTRNNIKNTINRPILRVELPITKPERVFLIKSLSGYKFSKLSCFL